MQFKIPQDVEREDKLLFFISLRQLFILLGGGGVGYLIYVGAVGKISPSFYVVPIVVVLIITVLFAFFKMENIDFMKLILLLLEQLINPQRRLWMSVEPPLAHLYRLDALTSLSKEETAAHSSEKKADSSAILSDLAQISRSVDIGPISQDEKKQDPIH